MTSEYVVLTVGLVTLGIIVISSVGFRAIKQKLTGKRRNNFSQFLEVLDRIRFLPVLWILTAVSIGYWLVARVIISYI
jgi:hypothetical protein